MFIKDGICYAGELTDNIKIVSAIYLGKKIMLITFSTGEKRLFDVSLLKGSAFQPLQNDNILKEVELFHGIMTWMNGEIDIAPETVYQMSFPYEEKSEEILQMNISSQIKVQNLIV